MLLSMHNYHKSPRLCPSMFMSSPEFNPSDFFNSNRKSSSLSTQSTTTATITTASPSASMRFRGNKFGRLKTKCLHANRYQQSYSLSNNRLHMCCKANQLSPVMTTSALKTIRRSSLNFPNSHWSNLPFGPQVTPTSSSSPPTLITDQNIRSNFLNDIQFPGLDISNANGALSSSASNSRATHHHSNNSSSNHNNLIDRPVVVLNPDEPREIFIGGVQSVALPLWAYCKCLTMVRGEPHELGPRLCLRLLQSLFSLHYLVTHNYNGSGGKAPIDPIVMSAVLRQAQLQFGSGYFFTEPMALGKLRDYLNNAFRVMAFRQRKGERVRSPFWNEKGEPIHDLEAPVEFSNITDIIIIPHSGTPTSPTNSNTATNTIAAVTTMSNESDSNPNSK
ncbi:hypothetical protein EWB00_006258 [Schistosoma japonicum]|uniref:DUF5725 domain-containing protein n=1 Tax=Schistosoma japonicum TaxID=6182 RepID=A0A4Z2CZC3_SCHJA|nr:hypothetical protein EWB00_006258 [Schistosoma japonicum]